MRMSSLGADTAGAFVTELVLQLLEMSKSPLGRSGAARGLSGNSSQVHEDGGCVIVGGLRRLSALPGPTLFGLAHLAEI